MKIFISYCDTDGSAFASIAAVALEENGHKAWYYDRDRTLGVMIHNDITYHIRHWCNKILYICTDGSITSGGQDKEIGLWYKTDKQLIVIPIENATVPEPIDPYNYGQQMSNIHFQAEFNIFVRDKLKDIFNQYEIYHPIKAANMSGNIGLHYSELS